MSRPQVVREVRRALEQVADGADRDLAVYRELRQQLDTVPPNRRNRRWRETSVLTDVLFRKRPKPTFRALRGMRQRREARGAGDDFARFWSECTRLLAPYTLGPHGYKPALGSTDQERVWQEVARIQSELAHGGHQCFLNSGSLLGLVREGRMIPHDDDVDLAVLLTATDPVSAADEWRESRRRWSEAGLLDERFEARRKRHCKARVAEGVKVDLFPAWADAGRVYVWPHTYGDVSVDDLLPLEQQEVSGARIWLPRRPEPLLESNYGADWRTPDPTWRFQWAQATQRFTDFLSTTRSPEAPGTTRRVRRTST